MTSGPPRLILASASPRRAAVLHQLGLEHDVRIPRVDETPEPGESPAALVERLARAKADAVAVDASAALVIAGDTVVVDGTHVLGKPADPAEALAILLRLAGRTHVVLSGIAIAGAHGTVSAVERTEVRMRAFDEAEARAYVATGEPLDKAGAYGIQGRGAALVAAISGDYYSVVGLPVRACLDLLERCGWRYRSGRLERGGPQQPPPTSPQES